MKYLFIHNKFLSAILIFTIDYNQCQNLLTSSEHDLIKCKDTINLIYLKQDT